MKPIIIFGNGTVAEVLYYFMQYHSPFTVAGFTVDAAVQKTDTFFDLPLVPFEQVTDHFYPEDYAMFIAIGYNDLNQLRTIRLKEAREKGYEIASYVHPLAGIPQNCTFGENCFIMDKVCIHPYVTLGENVFVWSGATIGHHSSIGDNCWLSSCVNIAGRVTVGKNCFFAVNATVGNRLTIGDNCLLGASTLLTKDLDNDKVLIAESTKPFRLDSKQFLKFSQFNNR